MSDKSNSLEVQTMYKIKTQKKNSASVSDANIPRLTSETNSGTSSLYNNNSINPTQSQIAPLPLNICKIATAIYKMLTCLTQIE